ncbi:hypothetical protein TUN205_07333 [Pyrenophora tritici-repentis]|nr:hypothetical protein TUN205_07333 [Pyrenophora tritici-repentis]
MQYYFVNILLVALPFVGSVSAQEVDPNLPVNPQAICRAAPAEWGLGGNCGFSAAYKCFFDEDIEKTVSSAESLRRRLL